MLHKTRGIVLKTVKYAESSIIAKVFTEKFGLRTYIINGLSGKNGRSKKVLLQSMSPVHLTVYEKHSADIQHVKDIESAFVFKTIYNDFRKSAILVFINEVVYKTLHEEAPNEDLFCFLFDTIAALDEEEKYLSGFHSVFMMSFARFLGFFPRNTFSSETPIFDMQEGMFVACQPLHSDYIHDEMSRSFSEILNGNPDLSTSNIQMRNDLLEKIIRFYALHVPSFGEIKSFNILKQVFDVQRKTVVYQ
jgi:DNA repair protein RecO (recombination protein O)